MKGKCSWPIISFSHFSFYYIHFYYWNMERHALVASEEYKNQWLKKKASSGIISGCIPSLLRQKASSGNVKDKDL